MQKTVHDLLIGLTALGMAGPAGVNLPVLGDGGGAGGNATDVTTAHWQAITLAVGQVAVMAGLLILTGHQYWTGLVPDDFLKSADLLLFAVYISQRVNLVNR